MDYLIDKTLVATNRFSPIDTLRYINQYWFADFYNVFWRGGDQDVDIEGRDLRVTGVDVVNQIANFVQQCKMNGELLKSLNYTPKFVDGKVVEIETPPDNFLLNVANSCALDSLLSIIFFARGGYFVSRIVDSSLERFPRWMDADVLGRAAKRIRQLMVELFNQTEWKRQNVRDIQQGISVFIEDDCNDVKSVNEIWGTFCTLFDGLSFPLWTKRQKEIGNNPVNTFSIPIGDNIFPKDLAEKPYHLVYLNDTDRSPKNFTDFGYSDLEGYELVGVVLHWGAHYTSLINVQETWYSYDDLSGQIKPYDGEVLKQTRQKTIAMMFYTKK